MGSTTIDPNIYCANCGEEAPADRADGSRVTCPGCGSVARQRRIAMEDTVKVTSEREIKARHGQPGEVAPHLVHKTGDSWSYRFAKWMQRTVRVDRENNHYVESVTDPDTGPLFTMTRGPLASTPGTDRRSTSAPPRSPSLGHPPNQVEPALTEP